jgi:hypothetical protein
VRQFVAESQVGCAAAMHLGKGGPGQGRAGYGDRVGLSVSGRPPDVSSRTMLGSNLGSLSDGMGMGGPCRKQGPSAPLANLSAPAAISVTTSVHAVE